MAEGLVNGLKLVYQQMGEGPDVVLVHGLATNRAFWYPAATQLARDFRVTFYDLRSHGYSQRAESGHTHRDMAADLEGLLDHLGIGRAAIVGHSYGGGAAIEMAAADPARVERLALLDTCLPGLQPQQRLSDSTHLTPFEIEICRSAGIDWDAETQVGLRFLDVAARRSLEGRPTAARDAFTPFGEGRGSQRAAKEWLALSARAFHDFCSPGIDAAGIRSRVRVPVLLMYGAHSRCMPTCRALQELLPDAECSVIQDAGHFFPATHAAFVLERLRGFLGAPIPA